MLDGRQPPSLSEAELAAVADHTSMTERRSAAAERDLLDWKRAKFMEERLGDEFEGLITAAGENGLWVELADLYIEGFVPIDSFGRERFDYRENLRALVGVRSKRRYGIGDRVWLRCDRVRFDRLKAEFSIVEGVGSIGEKATS